ncbi:uncharacterized protein LOC116210293 isoform X2 [Punica granatum]|uniref:Uncharacterized protein LOC116210293 isoform X2 n=1 Tax=Punica granatum TaxID=22663 RepID=A0A6P8DWB0_PUNGR|nr:uncharacterized protein LOC116210293 isoform X2 [Punica granatum]
MATGSTIVVGANKFHPTLIFSLSSSFFKAAGQDVYPMLARQFYAHFDTTNQKGGVIKTSVKELKKEAKMDVDAELIEHPSGTEGDTSNSQNSGMNQELIQQKRLKGKQSISHTNPYFKLLITIECTGEKMDQQRPVGGGSGTGRTINI